MAFAAEAGAEEIGGFPELDAAVGSGGIACFRDGDGRCMSVP